MIHQCVERIVFCCTGGCNPETPTGVFRLMVLPCKPDLSQTFIITCEDQIFNSWLKMAHFSSGKTVKALQQHTSKCAMFSLKLLGILDTT